jgi:hypothetical protein
MAEFQLSMAKPAFRRMFDWSSALQWTFLIAIALVILAPIMMVTLDGFNVAGPFEPFRFGFTQCCGIPSASSFCARCWGS